MSNLSKFSHRPSVIYNKEPFMTFRLYPDYFLVLRAMPGDGNCLYHSINYLFTQGKGDPQKLRTIARKKLEDDAKKPLEQQQWAFSVAAEPEDFVQYCEKIEKNSVWGGEVEISLLAAEFKTELWVFNIPSDMVSKFNEGAGNGKVGIIIHYKQHFEVVVMSKQPNNPQHDETLLPLEDAEALENEIKEGIFYILQERSADFLPQYSNVKDSKVEHQCTTCDQKVLGELGQINHRWKTGGHDDFLYA